VVVTALGIEREKQSLGYATQELNGDQLNEAREANFTSMLSGKVAGLDIKSNAGVGSSTRIILRGESSLNFNGNQPLFVVDGIPINNSINNTSSADFGNGASEINPADIESVNVLKGPAAAALYGARASNGVIIITTKSGKGQRGLGISVNTGITFEDVLRLPRFQNEFGQGNSGLFEGSNFGYQGNLAAYPNGVQDGFDESWGPRLNFGPKRAQFDSPTTNGYRGGDVHVADRGDVIPTPWVSQPNNVHDFFEIGHTVFNNIAFSGGNDKGHFRLSLTNQKTKGIVPNNDLERNTAALNASFNVSEKLRTDVVLNYIKTESDNRPDQGYGRNTPMYFMLWMGRQVNMNSLRRYWQPGLEGLQQFQYNYGENHNNPFFYQYENTSGQVKDRVVGSVAATYNFTDRLSLMVRTATDFSIDHRTFRLAWSTVESPKGRYRVNDLYMEERNTDFLLRYEAKREGFFGAVFSVGANRRDDKGRTIDVTAPELTVPGIYNLGNSAAAIASSEYNYRKRVNSVYALAQLDYDNKIFLDITGRNDWSSTLPPDANSYFYPSVALSALLNEFFETPLQGVDQIKLRAGWAQVGNDTGPYALYSTYSAGQPWGTIPTLSESGTLRNPQLKPESITTLEYGINVVLFDRRVDLDLTYYTITSKDQILPLSLTGTSGYESRIINAGEIKNSGIEIMLNATPVLLPNGFRWDISLNYAKNQNKVVALAPGIPAYVQTAPGEEATVEARVGERMGALYGPGFERVPSGPLKGQIIIGANGLPIKTTQPIYLGNFNPDWTGGVSNTFSFKGIFARALFDIRQGGVFISRFYNKGMGAGILEESAYERAAREPGKEYEGLYYHEGAAQIGENEWVPNRTSTDGTASEGVYGTAARAYYKQYHDHNSESQLFDASFVKLREIAIGYSVPQKLLGNIPVRDVRISFVGRNLKLWTDNIHFDPEGTMATSGGGLIPGFENMSLPSTKSYGVNLSFKL
jgi:TonB-linked SusC/RagA family outer membrane protein